MEEFVSMFKSFNKKKIRKTVNTNSFIIFLLIGFFPLGLFLLWKSKNFKKTVKIAITIIGSYWFLLFINNSAYSSHYQNELNLLKTKYEQLEVKTNTIEEENTELLAMKDEFELYKGKMKPFEKEAQKIENDKNKANELNKKLDGLTEIAFFELDEKEKVTEINNIYKQMSKEQKAFVNISKIDEYNKKIKEKEEEEIKKIKEEEKKEAELKEHINNLSAEEKQELEEVKKILEKNEPASTDREPTDEEDEQLRVYARMYIDDMESGKKIKHKFYYYEDFKVFAIGTGKNDWNVKGNVELDGKERKYSIDIRLNSDSAQMLNYKMY